MDRLGRKLRLLRKGRDLTGPTIAARALGEKATPRKIKSFANYLSRLERGRAKNPSLVLLEQLAKGFGDDTLSSFIAQIEAADGSPNPPLNLATKPTQDRSGLPSQGAEHAFAVPTSPVVTITEDSARLIGRAIGAALASTIARLIPDRSAPSAGAGKTGAAAADPRGRG